MLPARISYRVIEAQVEGNLVYPFHREPLKDSAPRKSPSSLIGNERHQRQPLSSIHRSAVVSY